MPEFFPGFSRGRVRTAGTEISYRMGGNGPPLLLLHGYPQTHVTWHKVAPLLAAHYTVVVPDLRGYGDSGKPAGGEGHANYAKRAMALDQVELMRQLGFGRYAVVGHDRGARVAHRMALDHPDAISRLALLDIVPGAEVYGTADRAVATAYFHWFFLIQRAPYPERLLEGDPDAFLSMGMRPYVPQVVTPEAYAEYLRCASDPAAIHAICEDYRAGATIDLAHDAADAGRRIGCPVLVLWGARGIVGKRYDVLGIWQRSASDVQGHALDASHWIPEEVPQKLAADLHAFLGADRT